MASSSSWKNEIVTRSLLERARAGPARAGEERHPALAQALRHPLRAGEEEALVQPEEAAVRAEVRELGDLGEEIHELRETLGELPEELVRARGGPRLLRE